jgi:hypothetical protein
MSPRDLFTIAFLKLSVMMVVLLGQYVSDQEVRGMRHQDRTWYASKGGLFVCAGR